AVRRVADEDFSGFRSLLEARRDVDGVAEDTELAFLVADRAGDRKSGVDPHTEGEVPPGPLGDALVLALERAEDGEGRVLRALRMVLLRLDRSEDRDDRVADVLLDQPALIADVGGDRVPGSAHVLVKLLGIEPLGECGEPGDVGEQDGDLLRLAVDGLEGRESRAALAAEAELSRHLRFAFGAGDVRSSHDGARSVGRGSGVAGIGAVWCGLPRSGGIREIADPRADGADRALVHRIDDDDRLVDSGGAEVVEVRADAPRVDRWHLVRPFAAEADGDQDAGAPLDLPWIAAGPGARGVDLRALRRESRGGIAVPRVPGVPGVD